MKDFIKKYGTKISIALICLFVATYLWFIFRGGLPAGDGLEKGDWLAFWGSFLSFSGSVVLGAVSVWQNTQANETNRKAITENQRVLQIQFENDLERNKYVQIITSTQHIAQRISDVNKQLVNFSLQNFPSPDNDVRELLVLAIKKLDPVITDIQFLCVVEIDSVIPVCYDEEFPVLKENRQKIKSTLNATISKIEEYKKDVISLEGKRNRDVFIQFNFSIPMDALIAIISYFEHEIDLIPSRNSFVDKEGKKDEQ